MQGGARLTLLPSARVFEKETGSGVRQPRRGDMRVFDGELGWNPVSEGTFCSTCRGDRSLLVTSLGMWELTYLPHMGGGRVGVTSPIPNLGCPGQNGWVKASKELVLMVKECSF